MEHHINPCLAIGPANCSGQAYQWALAVERHLGVPAISFAVRCGRPVLPIRARGFGFPVHRSLPHHRLSTPLGKAWRMNVVLGHVTHVAVDGFLSLYGRLDKLDIGHDIARLKRRGLRVALIAHGSELRDPDRHRARYEFSYYTDAPEAWIRRLRARSQRNREIIASTDAPLFVASPDLVIDTPQAHWLPFSIDTSPWFTDEPALQRAVPRVLHLPSKREPPLKGSDIIDPILRDLARRGVIEYLAPANVPHSSMPDLIRRADIVVDQIRSSFYGVAAAETMAAGRLVIGSVGPRTRAALPENPPIVDAHPGDFRDVMEDVLSRRRHYAERARAGVAFARRWHDGHASARTLFEFLGMPGRLTDPC
jgi:hypothetical protein